MTSNPNLITVPATSTILCVLDVNGSMASTLKFAIRIAELNDATLTVLYPYRLTGLSGGDVSRQTLDVEAGSTFHRFAAPLLSNSGIKCDFRAEVGFLKDRVHAFARKNNAGLVIVSREIANSNKEGVADLLEVVEIPLLVVP